MKQIDKSEVAARWEEIQAAILNGEEIVLADGGEPCFKLTTVPKPGRRIPGLNRGKYHMAPDFNDPLPDSFWLGEE